MNKRLTSPFNGMPGEVLASEVKRKSLEVAGNDSFQTKLSTVGYLLRSYSGLLYGDSPISRHASIDGIDPLHRLPARSLDALTKVANACIETVALSSETDDYPILPKGFTYEYDEDGEAYFSIRDVLPAVQMALEGVDDPHPELRQHMIDNEMDILLGNIDPAKTRVLRLSGPSLVTREATRELALTIGDEFGSFFGGIEFLIPDEDSRMRDSMVHYVGTVVGSQWQQPDTNWV